MQEPVFAIGNLPATRITTVNVDSFKLQKEIKLSKGYKFKSAHVYFSGANFPNIYMAYLDTVSLYQLDTLINKCMAGSVVTFDSIKLTDKKNAEIKINPKSYLFYPGKSNKDKVDSNVFSANNKELFKLMKKDFISGVIYFSGENFSNVITVHTYEKEQLKLLYARVAPGSIVTFNNCIYKNIDGTTSELINKSLKMD